jgi:tetratricopeptide (TPR) repeat protein
MEGVIECNLAAAYIGLGHHEQAVSHTERSLAVLRQVGDRDGEAYVLGHAARAQQGMGAHSDVIALCELALSIGDNHTYPSDRAETLDTLGTSLQSTGDIKRATTCWREAVDILDRLADPRAAELRARLRALEATRACLMDLDVRVR